MKKICCVTLLLLLVGLLFSGCESTPKPNNAPVTQSTISSIKTDDSIWYSEEADVRGRLWLDMTEKEVYDVLNQYNIPIKELYSNSPELNKYDEYGALYLSSPYDYHKKQLYTEGHQHFYFDEDDQLEEICYFDQMHYTSDPVNKEFEAQRGVKRGDTYEDMIKAYGEPDQVVDLDSSNQSYVYHLENGDYLHFVYQGVSTPIQSMHYSKYPYLFSY